MQDFAQGSEMAMQNVAISKPPIQSVAQAMQNVAQAIQNAVQAIQNAAQTIQNGVQAIQNLITTLSSNSCTNFIGSAVLCWARGYRYVAKPAHFNSWVPRGVKSIGPATQFAIHLSNGTPLNDVAGALKYWPWRAKRTSSLSNHFHLTIPRVYKMPHLPLKTRSIVKWRALIDE